MKRLRIWLTMLIGIFLLTACEQSPESQPQQKLVIALFSPGGLGDRGYNDQILYGLQSVHKQRTDCAMLLESPETMEDAELIFHSWLERQSTGIPCLFILASAEYEAMAQRVLSTCSDAMMQNKTILLFETDTEFPYERVYTFRINMYGASYLAGTMAAVMGMQSPIIMLGSAIDVPIHAAADGFMDGYYAESGNLAALDAFAYDWTGYAMSEHAYEIMPILSNEYDFIYPVAGGTNLGVYRYLREHPDGPYVAGMDIDQSPFSNNIVGSLIKHIDQLVIDGVNGWLDHPLSNTKHTVFGLESGYVDWQIADRYMRYTPAVEAARTAAIECEKIYESK